MARAIPACSLRYDEWNGDYNCEAIHDQGCEGCLVQFRETGGLWNPETGKKWDVKGAKRLFRRNGVEPKEQSNG